MLQEFAAGAEGLGFSTFHHADDHDDEEEEAVHDDDDDDDAVYVDGVSQWSH